MATNKDKNKLFKTFKSGGKIHHLYDNKLHSWDGPAIYDEDGFEEYYVYGLQVSKSEWKQRKWEIDKGYDTHI